jgi:hypothetical protein
VGLLLDGELVGAPERDLRAREVLADHGFGRS